MTPDFERCYRAMTARDASFDGRFVVASRTTGTYCRPSCATRRPTRANAVFFARAIEAEREAYRACMRCGAASGVLVEAVARIEAGALNGGKLDELASALGVSGRHLRRTMQAELGVSPIELAQSRRLALARKLVEETSLGMTEIAYAAGFGSLRRFNALFAAAHGEAPSKRRAAASGRPSGASIALRLEHAGPLAWSTMLAYLDTQLVAGVERADRFAYTRLVRLGGHRGWVACYPRVNQHAVIAEISLSLVPVVMPIVARLRRLFDLDADPASPARDLAADPAHVPHVGLRVPGAFDGFEAAVVAIAGAPAATRIARALGEPYDLPYAPLERLPFTAEDAAAAPARTLGRDHAALRALATAVAEGRVSLEPSGDPERVVEQLAALGVPPVALPAIAMRALRDRDALPADLAPTVALERTELWRPWRALGAMHVWATSPKEHAS